jgi:hypothetical protein
MFEIQTALCAGVLCQVKVVRGEWSLQLDLRRVETARDHCLGWTLALPKSQHVPFVSRLCVWLLQSKKI